MDSTMRLTLLAGLLLVSVRTVSAQSAPAFSADVETTYRFQNGRETNVGGRFYRSADGRIREDSGSGSLITDVRRRTITMLNAELKQALVLQMPEPIPPPAGPKGTPPAFERGMLDGRAVEKTRQALDGGAVQEVWFASDLGTVLYSLIEAPGLTTVRTLRNVSTDEPPAAVFEVPAEYAVTRRALPPEPQGVPVTRAPKRTP